MAEVLDLPPHDQIGRQWRSYRINVLPARCSEIQERETRRAFYAGAQAAIAQVLATSSIGTEDQQVDSIEALVEELKAFGRQVGNGRG